jgi:hypothetical protein
MGLVLINLNQQNETLEPFRHLLEDGETRGKLCQDGGSQECPQANNPEHQMDGIYLTFPQIFTVHVKVFTNYIPIS